MTTVQEQLNAVDRHGNSALHLAAIAGLPNHVAELLARGSSPLLRNQAGLNPHAVAIDPDCRRLLAAAIRDRSSTGPFRRILMVGNTNNYPLLLAEGLRMLGHEVCFCVNRREMRHRPESKYPSWKGGYPDWVIDCPELTDDAIAEQMPSIDVRMKALSAEVDFVIVNDTGPAVARCFSQPKVALLTGSDLTYHANFRSLDWRTSMWDLEYRRTPEGRGTLERYARLVASQRDGILSSELVSFAPRGLVPEGDDLLDSIGVADRRRVFILMSDTIGLEASPLPSLDGPLRILCGARIDWLPGSDGNRSSQDLKGTEVLLEGFARYCRDGGRAQLKLIRKGHDVLAAVELTRALGIEDQVAWIDNELPLDDYHREVRSAHLIVDQLAQSFPGMVTTDAFAMGRPVLANFRNDIFSKHLAQPLPGFQAASAIEVADQLKKVDGARSLLASMGSRGRRIAEDFLSPEVVAADLLARVSPLLREER